jgi:hypothetical protein
MKNCGEFLKRIVFSLAIICSVNAHSQQQESNSGVRSDYLAQKINGLLKKMNISPEGIGQNWEGNPEIKELLRYPSAKRLAVINTILVDASIDENEIFTLFTELEADDNWPALQAKDFSYQWAMLVSYKFFLYSSLRELTTSSEQDKSTRDFLDAEIADLRKPKIKYETYFQSRMQRSLLFTNSQQGNIAEEMQKITRENDLTVKNLSMQIRGNSVIKTCSENAELCEKFFQNN